MLMGESTSINWNKSATDSKIRLLSPPWQPLIRHLLKNRKMDCDSEHSGKDASSSMSSKCLGLDKCTIIGVTHPAKNCDHQAKHSFPVLPFCALTRGVVVKISRRHLSTQCASSSHLSPLSRFILPSFDGMPPILGVVGTSKKFRCWRQKAPICCSCDPSDSLWLFDAHEIIRRRWESRELAAPLSNFGTKTTIALVSIKTPTFCRVVRIYLARYWPVSEENRRIFCVGPGANFNLPLLSLLLKFFLNAPYALFIIIVYSILFTVVLSVK